MSDEHVAVDGAVVPEAAPVIQAEQPQQPATEETPEAREERARDERGRFQSRINQVIAERGRAERERDALRMQLEQFQQQSQTVKPSTDKPPRLQDFEDVDAWSEAMASYATSQAEKRATERYQQVAQQQSQGQVFQKFAEREQAYASANPDYQTAVSQLHGAVQFHPALVEVVAAKESGPAIVHYLAQHVDEADRIARMNPLYAAAEIGRIEAKVTAPKQIPVSKAPPPTPTVGSGSAVVAKGLNDELSIDEWVSRRNDQLKHK